MMAECKLWPGKTIIALALPMTFASAFAQTPADNRPSQESKPTGRQRRLNLPASKDSIKADIGSITFVGTATVIILYAGLTILTDPNFLHKGGHVHLGYGLTSERLTDPAITLDKLPPIDLIVLSHMHGDHFDQLVQQKLDRNVPVVTTPDTAKNWKSLASRHAMRSIHGILV